jgi:protein-S-isoprenylcysteine O-methyltransferase Ste14
MRITRAAALCFEIWYQSRISIAVASAALTATSSRILIGSIDWRSVIIVALCTVAAYQADDVVDFRRDLERARIHLSANMRSFKLVAVMASISIAFVALHGRPFALAELLLFCALLTLAFCLASSRLHRDTRTSHLWVTLRTVYVSLVWSLVAVLTPILDCGKPINRPVRGAILFIFALMLTVSAFWAEGEHPERRERHLSSHAYDRAMLVCCAFASLLVVYGIVRQDFHWQNIALLAACISNALFIAFRRRFRQVDHRVINEAMIMMNLFACLFVMGAYDYPNDGFGPRTMMDWFQLGACAIFFGNIAWKSATLKAPDDNGGYLDLLLTLGLAIFGFQMVVACLHVERWLLPAVHGNLFHSQAASIAGVVIVLFALILQSFAYIWMADSWRLMAIGRGPSALVTTGPFALTRNPIYLSSDLFIVGVFLMNGTLVFALFLLIAPIVIHAQILREEDFLLACYPESYRQYLGKVPRYITVYNPMLRSPSQESTRQK